MRPSGRRSLHRWGISSKPTSPGRSPHIHALTETCRFSWDIKLGQSPQVSQLCYLLIKKVALLVRCRPPGRTGCSRSSPSCALTTPPCASRQACSPPAQCLTPTAAGAVCTCNACCPPQGGPQPSGHARGLRGCSLCTTGCQFWLSVQVMEVEAALLEQQELVAELRCALAAAQRRAQSPLKASMGVQVCLGSP